MCALAMRFLPLLVVVCMMSVFPKYALCDIEEGKATNRKKRNNQRTINAILKSRDDNNLYGILGLPNNRYLSLPGRSLTIIPKYFSIHIPELTFFRVSKNQIKRAFRQRAILAHPDKTADPRAAEAFNAVDEAAKTLLDEKARREYDLSVTLGRRRRRAVVMANVVTAMDQVWGLICTFMKRIRGLLGPFTVPVVVIAFLVF